MQLIKLTNGETLELNINMLTLKLILNSKINFEKLDKENTDSVETINIVAKLIHAIMYSNGKKITEDDAMELVPLGDTDSFFIIIEEFQSKVEQFQKKAVARSNLKKVAS